MVRAPGPAAARPGAGARSLIQLNLGGRRDPIEHVVVLMLENRSFDHMLGAMREHVPDLDGIDPARPGRNTDPLDGGRVYEQAPTSTTALEPDPKHELSHVQRQLDFDGHRCGGFVADFRMAYNTPQHVTREVMAYYHDEYTFDQFGLRVPAILISPWLAAGVCKTELDHTSLLKYVSDKWRLGPLGARTLHANSFANQFLGQPRTSTPRRLGEPDIPRARAALAVPRREPPLNDLQRSLLAMTEVLEAETPQPLAAKAMRARRTLDGPQAQAQVANERVERFLTHRRNRRTSAATRRHRED